MKQGILQGKKSVCYWIEEANTGHMAVRKVFDLFENEYRNGRLTLQQFLAAKVRVINDPESEVNQTLAPVADWNGVVRYVAKEA